MELQKENDKLRSKNKPKYDDSSSSSISSKYGNESDIQMIV
jgi:hypothetical protein